jgi:bacterioferritin
MDRTHSIDLLNVAVGDELRTVHQYMYFHFHLSDEGFKPLAALFKRTAIEEMGHIEAFAERILFLKGDVTMTPAGAVETITEPEAMLLRAMAMEQGAIQMYNKSAVECGAHEDAASKQLFERILGVEERHFDQFEKQHEHINRFGLNYLALQSFGEAEAEGGPAGA